jgi:uncharacterized cupin superfamily protein/glutathione S-transferase
MIKLYQFAPAFGLPNPSPFCMTLENYLRMAGLPFETPRADLGTFRRAPKGKLPYIEDNGRLLADSAFIIDYLKATYGDKLDTGLTAQQKAISLAFRRLMEEDLYWVGIYSRWAEPAGWAHIREAFFGRLPTAMKWVVCARSAAGFAEGDVWPRHGAPHARRNLRHRQAAPERQGAYVCLSRRMPQPRLPALDPGTVEKRHSSAAIEPFRSLIGARTKQALGDGLGLTKIGINLTELAPGSQSSLRHWHTHEDELVYVLEGELTLITEAGAQVLTPGMCAGFPAGRQDGHHFVNRSNRSARYLEISDRNTQDMALYPDDDLMWVGQPDGRAIACHRDGTPYPTRGDNPGPG